MVSDPEVRQLLIKSLAFENSNLECKMVIRPLKARTAPVDEWIRNAADNEYHALLCYFERSNF